MVKGRNLLPPPELPPLPPLLALLSSFAIAAFSDFRISARERKSSDASFILGLRAWKTDTASGSEVEPVASEEVVGGGCAALSKILKLKGIPSTVTAPAVIVGTQSSNSAKSGLEGTGIVATEGEAVPVMVGLDESPDGTASVVRLENV